MNLRRLLALAVVAAAACTTSVASPDRAFAHYGDPLHQHGWNTALMFNPNPARCYDVALYNGMGQFSVTVPDLMTTPGGNQYVAYRAQLEYLVGSTWRDRYFDGSTWRYLPSSSWNYALANSSGLAWAVWLELGTNRFGPRGTIGFNVLPGFTYRYRLYYYWYYDGHTDQDVTSTCAVSRVAGAKATKQKGRSRPTVDGRTRAVSRVPGVPPARGAIGG
jgi:hypothetical protein